MMGRIFICCLTNVMWYIRTRSRMNKFFTPSFGLSFVCLFVRSFICLFTHSFARSLCCCCANDSFGRLPRCHFYTYIKCRTFYAIIIAWFNVLLHNLHIFSSFSGIFSYCSKDNIFACPVHFDELKLLVRHTSYPSHRSFPVNELKHCALMLMQSYINAKRNFNGLCVHYHLFTLE